MPSDSVQSASNEGPQIPPPLEKHVLKLSVGVVDLAESSIRSCGEGIALWVTFNPMNK